MSPKEVWSAVARCKDSNAVRFGRKPGSFTDPAIPTINEDAVRAAIGPVAWDHLIVHQPEDIWPLEPCQQPTPFTSFSEAFYQNTDTHETEYAFVVRLDGVDYLINTEGYDYCRYVARLERN